MRRVVVVGNGGGGKSTLARRLAVRLNCPCVEIDTVLWQPGWRLTPVETYDAEHARLIAGDEWIIDGLGRQESIPPRLSRATDIVLVDMDAFLAGSRAAAAVGERHAREPAGRHCRDSAHRGPVPHDLGGRPDMDA